MSQCEAFIQHTRTLVSPYTNNVDRVISQDTYSIVVSVVDISSLVNKVFHCMKIACLSCCVQGSILLKRKLQI